MRVLVTGAHGMLGTDLVPALASAGHEVVATDRDELDITDPESVARLAAGELGEFGWVLNCAAYTAVDKAESEEQLATDINGLAVSYLAQAAGMQNARILHISTDFVFDGSSETPYDEEAKTNPLGVYGRSKLQGELALIGNPRAIILRTAWLYGPNGPSFPRTMIRAYRAGKELKVVEDAFGSPTSTVDLSQTILQIVEKDPFPGIYHATGPDVMNWHQFAEMAIEVYTGEKPKVEPIDSGSWPTPAKRPKYSALSNAKIQAAGISPMRPTSESLAEFCEALRAKEDL